MATTTEVRNVSRTVELRKVSTMNEQEGYNEDEQESIEEAPPYTAAIPE
jgi:hypothetical protein